MQTLLDRAAKTEDYKLTVSLEDQTVKDDQGFSTSFTIDPFRRYCLLEGLDDIGLSMRHAAALDKFEQQHDAAFWVAAETSGESARMSSTNGNGQGKLHSIALTRGRTALLRAPCCARWDFRARIWRSRLSALRIRGLKLGRAIFICGRLPRR